MDGTSDPYVSTGGSRSDMVLGSELTHVFVTKTVLSKISYTTN